MCYVGQGKVHRTRLWHDPRFRLMTAFLEICTRKLVEDLLQWTFLSLTFEFTFPTQDRECVLTAIIIFCRDFLSSLTAMIVKSGHGSLLSKIVSTSTFQQESRIKDWLCQFESLQVMHAFVKVTIKHVQFRSFINCSFSS